ncbi:ATP-binding protein [Streptomyces sp. NPDC002817]
MSERTEQVSRALSARAATLAQRLAGLLDATCSAESGAPQAAAFLRDWATAAIAAGPGAGLRGDPLAALVERFGLCDDERDLLLLAGLPEEHEGLAGTFRSLHPRSEPRPTVGLAALLLGDPRGDRSGLRRLLAEGAAVRHGLLRVEGGRAETCYERALAPAEQLWDALHGHDAWPGGIQRVAVDEPPAGLDGWLALPSVRWAVDALRSADPRTLLLSTGDEVIAASRCAALGTAAGRSLTGARVSTADSASIALVAAHAAARDAVPVLFLDAPAQDGRPVPALDVEDLPGPVVVCAPPGTMRPVGRRPVLGVPSGPVGTDGQRRTWRAELPELADRASQLMSRHPMDPAVITEVAADVRSMRRLSVVADDPVCPARGVSDVIRGRAGIVLPPGVGLLTPDLSWRRLVLPDETVGQLRDAVARLEHASLVLDEWDLLAVARAGRGVRLMFTGPPGTGKSLAAEVVATALGTDLLVVDVSQVVSKWLGETEKNLAGVFDAAERTRAVLLLDEADALFATRTGITDAHDRYANLETAYLLQRMDRFDGLAVLTTNLRQNIDAAFLRRMDFVVDFPLPDEHHRRLLWELHLPEAALADGVDLGLLSTLYPVPGGWIRNAAIAAAFLAAPRGGPIHQHHLVHAMAREYAKAARPFPGSPVPAS